MMETCELSYGLACPECLAEVRPAGEGWKCSSCQLVYPIIDGIPVFCRNPEFQYGTIANEDILQILRLCEDHGWESGLAAFLETQPIPKADILAHYMVPEFRAGGKLLLNLDSSATVLDLGCGLGTLSVNISRDVAKVTAVDAGLLQLRLLQLRAKEAGMQNLQLICAGDRRHLPFPAGSFDIVILNGVLEWVAYGRSGHPRDLQRAFLVEVARVLKPAGQVYLGIENRLGYGYLRGEPDEHTGLRFVHVLPRRIADLLSLWKRGKPFREYTYSRMGYRKLLGEAGFSKVRFYLPDPNYRDFNSLLNGQPSFLRHRVNGIKTHLASVESKWAKAILSPYLMHSYVMVAAKSQLQPSVIQRAVAHFEQWTTNQGSKVCKLQATHIRISRTSTAVVSTIDSERSSRFVIKIPFTPRSGERLGQHFAALQALRKDDSCASLREVLPIPIVELKPDGQTVFVESDCCGFDARLCYNNRDFLERIYRLGLDFLIKFHRPFSGKRHYQSTLWERWLEKREKFLDSILHANYGDRWHQLVDWVKDYLNQETIPLVWMHGDFWPGNLLVNEEGDRLVGVVDWKFSNAQGPPLIDLLHLLVYIKTFARRRGFGQLLAERLSAGEFEQDEQPLIQEYCQALGLPARSVLPLGILAWIDWVYHRYEIQGHLPGWRRRVIYDFLEAMGEVMSRDH